MEEIQVLMEEKITIRERIGSAIKSMIEWFNQKMADVKTGIANCKEKITTSLKHLISKKKDGSICSVEIKIPSAQGKNVTLCRENENLDGVITKVTTALKSLFSQIEKLVTSIITACKEAISSLIIVEKIDKEAIAREAQKKMIDAQNEQKKQENLSKAREIKDSVIIGIKETAIVITAIVAILGAVAKVRCYKTKK